ncbi:hypothetical protein Q1W73_15295 [Asticcacaulis sp. ZE23SCel15]|uniref:hypothetical protein n=1 Tax=Asticcacaulis sp. ZE23SCel15 TaxID=3059027 RepID=UPI00266051B4|nr:hypothetical protein [Asticcacaulis sp. ZE23SCel15]WKL57010.1 hypothetical protein Q1W73_15295 [Asticcacaulis sp. ZE23SCel15]
MGELNPQSARDDLAFITSLVGEGARAQVSGGVLLLTGGILYGIQCLCHWADMAGLIRLGTIGHLINGILPSVLFLIAVGIVMWRDRHKTQTGVASRALNAAFGGVGLANLFMNFVFGYTAITHKLWFIWMLYPIVLCSLMGAAWYVAVIIRRKAWLGVVSAGWFAAAFALMWRIETPDYMLILSAALFLLMGLPGYVFMRLAKAPA